MKLVTNGRLITRDASAQGYYEHGAVAFEGTKIVEVGEEAMLRAKYPGAEIIDAKGGVIMPAFINAHTHIYSALARGLSIVGNNPTNFYEVLDGTWWAIDRHLMMDGTRASAAALYIDSIKQGVTTIFDHHASYGEIPGTLHTIAEESKRLGLRSCLCYEVSDRDGEEKCLQAIQENADFITECEKNKDPMLAAMFGGHALFTISDKTFDRMVAANNGRTGYHIHVSEGMNDVYDSLQNYGRRPSSGCRTTVSGGQDHSGPLHPRQHRRNGDHQGDRHDGREQFRNPTWATPSASAPSSNSTSAAFFSAWAQTPTRTICSSPSRSPSAPSAARTACRTSAGARSRTCSSRITRRSEKNTSPTRSAC